MRKKERLVEVLELVRQGTRRDRGRAHRPAHHRRRGSCRGSCRSRRCSHQGGAAPLRPRKAGLFRRTVRVLSVVTMTHLYTHTPTAHPPSPPPIADPLVALSLFSVPKLPEDAGGLTAIDQVTLLPHPSHTTHASPTIHPHTRPRRRPRPTTPHPSSLHPPSIPGSPRLIHYSNPSMPS